MSRKYQHVLAAISAIALIVVATAIAIIVTRSSKPCHGGASSIGPVVIVNGKISPKSDTTPHMTGCKP